MTDDWILCFELDTAPMASDTAGNSRSADRLKVTAARVVRWRSSMDYTIATPSLQPRQAPIWLLNLTVNPTALAKLGPTTTGPSFALLPKLDPLMLAFLSLAKVLSSVHLY